MLTDLPPDKTQIELNNLTANSLSGAAHQHGARYFFVNTRGER